MLSISKSVGRAFEVLEYLRSAGGRCSTPDLEKALNYPYSSARAILKELSGLGYLRYEPSTKTYLPTDKLKRLGDWVQDSVIETEGLLALLDLTHRRIGETCALVAPSFIFCNLFEVRTGTQPASLQLPSGIGLPLLKSTTGPVLLSQMSVDQVEAVFRHTSDWAKSTNAPAALNKEAILRSIEGVRTRGYVTDFDGFRSNVGSIAYPLASHMPDFPLALLVCGPATRIKYREAEIHRALRRLLATRSSLATPSSVLTQPRKSHIASAGPAEPAVRDALRLRIPAIVNSDSTRW